METTSKEVAKKAAKLTKIKPEKVKKFEEGELEEFCDDVRSVAASALTQAEEKPKDALYLDLNNDASARFAAQQYAKSIARRDPEESRLIIDRVKEIEEEMINAKL